jgi:hypothetical protein
MVKIKKTKEKIVTEELEKKADASKNEEKAESVKKESAGSDMVTVACGIPMGQRLILSEGEVLLNGVPMSHIVSAQKGVGYLPAGKYGLTVLPRKQWEEILERYGKFDFIVNGVIFAKEDHDSAVAKAKELSEKKLGFEQADPMKGGKTQKKG